LSSQRDGARIVVSMTIRTTSSSAATAYSPVYAVFGTEDYLRRRALEGIVRRVLGGERDSPGLTDFDGDSANLADVLDEVRTLSLLSDRRLVIVRDADEFVRKHRDLLEKYVQAPCPTGVLVLVCKSWASNTRLYKLVASLGGNVECKPLKPSELAGWAIDHARTVYDCTLDSAAARRLVDLVGPSLGQLDMELSKLATCVAPRKKIGASEVEELVGASRVETVFGITDCVARRDTRGALALWEEVLATDRDAPYRAVGGLAYGFRNLAEAKRLTEQGLSHDEAIRRLRLWTQPARLRAQLDRFSLHQWQSHLVKLLHIDLGAKTGLGTVDVAVQKFIVELCAAG
jgi:DNA polymerase-3 subunit delta